MKPNVRWTDDCNGKKDYDGHLVDVSTRYWPAGGSTMTFNTAMTHLGLRQNFDPALKPSAHSSIGIRAYREDGYEYGDFLSLIEKEFVSDSEEETKRQVEEWVQVQMNRIVAALKNEYGIVGELEAT